MKLSSDDLSSFKKKKKKDICHGLKKINEFVTTLKNFSSALKR